MKIPYDMKNTLSILGLPTLRKHQLRPIQDILLRRDTFVIAPTGAGKSAIFQAMELSHRTNPLSDDGPSAASASQGHPRRTPGQRQPKTTSIHSLPPNRWRDFYFLYHTRTTSVILSQGSYEGQSSLAGSRR